MKTFGGLMSTPSYNEDLNAWLQQQISYLRDKKFEQLDIENIIEEIESVGKTERRSMKSHFVILIGHLLKLQYQPEKASNSWYSSIDNAQEEINEIIEDSPSLKREMQEKFDAAWTGAIKLAVRDTGLPRSKFPLTCPWTVAQAMKQIDDKNLYK